MIENVINELGGVGRTVTFKLDSTPSVNPKQVFYGRDKELKQIYDYFQNGERIIFLQGIGGIGKTEIAKQYAKRNKSLYDTIIYATYTNTIVELVSSETTFKIEPYFMRKTLSNGTQESDIAFFSRKMDLIKEITNERTLIIIDNFDVTNDENFKELLDANYKLLITTRCDHSKLYPTIKIEPIDSLEDLKNIFLKNYTGYVVSQDDKHLSDLIELVNRHTYTIELIAQHMENSGQTIEEMIDVLKLKGITSLNEQVVTVNNTNIAYENLLKMFKVFNLNDEEKRILQYLSLMPLSGVKYNDFKDWLKLNSAKDLLSLERRSWIIRVSNGLALHPIIREVIRYELPFNIDCEDSFINEFNKTICEEKSWHYSIDVKNYYADISSEIISIFNEINEYTSQLYKNIELLYSFSVKPAKAIELCEELYKYYEKTNGLISYKCAEITFQAGWTYCFNIHLKDAIKNAKAYFEKSFSIFSQLELNMVDEFASYGHLLSHFSHIYLILYGQYNDGQLINMAEKYAVDCVENAEKHLGKETPYYSRCAVAYMQLAEVCMAKN